MHLLDTFHQAMVRADIGKLEQLVDERYTLTHITGYLQPKQEWFDVITEHSFNYHEIDVLAESLQITVDGTQANCSGRGIFSATINSYHRPWRLAFSHQWCRVGDEWRLKYSRYTTF